MEKRFQYELNEFLTLELVGFLSFREGGAKNEHSHHFWELFYCYNEKIECELQKTVNLPLIKGEIAILPPTLPHSVNCLSKDSMFLYLGFNFNYSRIDMENIIGDIINIQSKILSFPNRDALCNILNEICIDIQSQNAKQAILQKNHLLPLLSLLIHHCFLHESVENSDTNIWVEKIKTYVQHNLSKNISVKDIADSLYLTPHHIGNIFKNKTGITIKEYIQRTKMQRAFILLSNENNSIKSTAFSLGFSSQQYFCNCFKKMYGISPNSIKKSKRT